MLNYEDRLREEDYFEEMFREEEGWMSGNDGVLYNMMYGPLPSEPITLDERNESVETHLWLKKTVQDFMDHQEEIGEANVLKDKFWFIKTVADFQHVHYDEIEFDMMFPNFDNEYFDYFRHTNENDGPENEWPWQNKDKLYDTTFGNSYYQIMRDVTIREQIMNRVYDIHE